MSPFLPDFQPLCLLASNVQAKTVQCWLPFHFHSLSSFSFPSPFSLQSVCNIHFVGNWSVCRHLGITVTHSLAQQGIDRVTQLTGELKLLWREASNIQKGNLGAPAQKPTPKTGGLQETDLHYVFKSLFSIWVLLLPVWLGSCWSYFVPHWIKLSISTQSLWGRPAGRTGGSARRNGRTRGLTAAQNFWVGKYSVREKGEVEEGGEERRRQRRGAGQSRVVGVHSILNTSMGHCPWVGVLLVVGERAASPRGGHLEGNLGHQRWPRSHSPQQPEKYGVSSPKSTRCQLCLFRFQPPAVRSLWMTRDF